MRTIVSRAARCGLTVLLWALAGSAAADSATANTFAANKAAAVESACRALVIDYAFYRDRLDADNYARVFAPDAVLSLQGNQFHGRETIRQRLLSIDGEPISRHMMSTIKIIPIDASTAHGVSYVTVYVEPASEQRPVATDGFVSVGEYHDVFKLTDQGWKIARREYRPVLARP